MSERSLLDYGGIRDGVTINTDAVARSMEACAVQANQTRQRCTVHIPPVRVALCLPVRVCLAALEFACESQFPLKKEVWRSAGRIPHRAV